MVFSLSLVEGWLAAFSAAAFIESLAFHFRASALQTGTTQARMPGLLLRIASKGLKEPPFRQSLRCIQLENSHGSLANGGKRLYPLASEPEMIGPSVQPRME